MIIKILGPGCPKCSLVEKRVKTVLAELDVAADVEKVADLEKMMATGIRATPGLIINGKIKSAGRIPRLEDIKTWIQEELE